MCKTIIFVFLYHEMYRRLHLYDLRYNAVLYINILLIFKHTVHH